MPEIPGYIILQPVSRSVDQTFYRATRLEDGQNCLVKVGREGQDSRLRTEYNLLSSLEFASMLQPIALFEQGSRPCMTLAEVDGLPLFHPDARPKDLLDRVKLMQRIVQAVSDLHGERIQHLGLSPGNIWVSRDHSQVWLSDFSLAGRQARRLAQSTPTRLYQYGLNFIAPEQTGRMNRLVDYRSDWYSVGAIFYELMTGQAPFPFTDQLELMHAILARLPKSPEAINPEIPDCLIKVMRKCLAKDAEQRYQSGFGLSQDLAYCQAAIEKGLDPEGFEPGLKDGVSVFQIPQRLYGRGKEHALLLENLEAVRKGESRVVWISGYSGIGKTQLVRELQATVSQSFGSIISGKYDPFKRNVPFAALIQAINELIHAVVAQPEERIAAWKTRIMEALGENAGVLVSIIPEMSLLIGEQPAAPDLPSLAGENRLYELFQSFLDCLSYREHPLIIFLDDLQWADHATLKLLEMLLDDQSKLTHLLFIGAYRSNEVDSGHPLHLTFSRIAEKNTAVRDLHLAPIALTATNELIKDTFHVDDDDAMPLTRLCHGRTGGNPFFLNQFLTLMVENEVIHFDADESRWNWDLGKVEEFQVTENVVDLLIHKMSKMPKAARELLKRAACIGTRFDDRELAAIHEDKEALSISLIGAAYEGFIHQLTPPGGGAGGRRLFRFAHDRFHQAAYKLLSDKEARRLHYQLGTLQLETLSEEEQENRIFDMVEHLQEGRSHIADAAQAAQVSDLSLRAGKRAMASASYDTAARYLVFGIELLGDDPWTTDYDKCLELHVLCVEAFQLSTRYDAMEPYYQAIVEHARDPLDAVKAEGTKILAMIGQKQSMDALLHGVRLINGLGLQIPEQPTPEEMQEAIADLEVFLKRFPLTEWSKLEEMTDRRALALVSIVGSLGPNAFQVNFLIFAIMFIRTVIHCIEKGLNEQFGKILAAVGFILCGVANDIQNGFKMGLISLDLVDRFDIKEERGGILTTFYATTNFWQRPYRENIQPLYEAHRHALAHGDFNFGAGVLFEHNLYRYFLAVGTLDDMKERFQHGIALSRRLKQDAHLAFSETVAQAVVNLMDETDDPADLNGAYYTREKRAEAAKNEQGLEVLFASVHQLLLAHLFNDHRRASEECDLLTDQVGNLMGTLHYFRVPWLVVLTRLADLEAGSSRVEEVVTSLKPMLDILERLADLVPANAAHYLAMARAEIHRARDEPWQAFGEYTRAGELAQVEGLRLEEAIAHELFGQFLIRNNKLEMAQTYLQKAYDFYEKWGALAKTDQMLDRYSDAFGIDDTMARKMARSTGNIDAASLLKATQALSREIVLADLLDTLLGVAIENAGANAGAVLFQKDDVWKVQAGRGRNMTGDDVAFPATVVNSVVRTAKAVVVGDAATDLVFSDDPYIRKHQPKSVLCTPVMHKGEIVALLYLENRLSFDVFTQERLEMLHLLVAQAAISIENARQYTNLEQIIDDRTQELRYRKNQMESSIQYAERIQSAILPEADALHTPHYKSFVIFKPYDIVSGDFFWADSQSKRSIVAVADCTGHGVPGAFMSIIGNTLLNQVIKENGLDDPAAILDQLNLGIRKALRQESTRRAADGMDISLVAINPAARTITFAGAKRTLYMVSNGNLVAVKGDRQSIGGHQLKSFEQFTNHTRSYETNDMIYLVSDGYEDAVNPQRKRFGTRRMKQLLTTVAHLELAQQQEIMEQTLETYRDGALLRDDLTVVGLKLS